MRSSITKYIAGGVIVVAFAAYVVFSSNNNTSLSSSTPISPSPATSSTPTKISSTPPKSTTGSTAISGTYKDGTYTGTTADAFYGSLQVTAVIQGGKLTDVQFPTYPSDNGHSQQVSSNALPILKQEAIAAQSANVNAVSGATPTSQAFRQSLASALAQAKA